MSRDEKGYAGHTLSVQERRIPGALADINVDPLLPVCAVHFRPQMVLGIPDPSDSASQCTAKHAETCRPLADTSTLGVDQHKGIVVSWEALKRLALGIAALVQLHPRCTASLLLR